MDPGLNEANRGPKTPWTRERVADFILRNSGRVRAIARAKLFNRTRRWFDSEDVLSSALRRADAMVVRGELQPANEAELWGLVRTITANDAITKNRVVDRLANLLNEDGDYVRDLLKQVQACDADEDVAALLHKLASNLTGTGRAIFYLRLRGASHRAAGDALDISEEAARQQGATVRRNLATAMADAHE